MTKTQLRGICQCCGRQQAVLAGSGRMSKHGYTVDHGWFNGVCSGQHYLPLQKDRQQADLIVVQVREQCLQLDERVAQLRAGTIRPERVKTNRWDPKAREAVTISWEEASPYQRSSAVEAEVYKAEARARAGRQFADGLSQLADAVFGQELVEVKLEDGPAPILCGEVRVLENGRKATVTRVQGARVYWTDERGFKGWTGTTAWRKRNPAE